MIQRTNFYAALLGIARAQTNLALQPTNLESVIQPTNLEAILQHTNLEANVKT